MLLSDINPYIRFASSFFYKALDNPVKICDCRIFYTLSGKGEIFIENQHYILTPKSLFFCCAGSVYNIKSSQGVSLISINFDLSQKYSSITEAIPPYSPDSTEKILREAVEDSSILNSHIFINDSGEFFSSFSKILHEFTTKKIHYRKFSGAILNEILICMHRKTIENTISSATSINTVIDYINSNFSKEISNKDLADIAGYHEYHLNRLFFKYTGTSMHNYILNIRINESKRLILNSELPLNIISEKVGFKSYTNFSSYFKKVFSLSPLAYKNKFKNKI